MRYFYSQQPTCSEGGRGQEEEKNYAGDEEEVCYTVTDSVAHYSVLSTCLVTYYKYFYLLFPDLC
jgi:hypothetical protein